MKARSALHIRMFASISDRVRAVTEEQTPLFIQKLPFKEGYAFLQRLKPWHPSFVKPPTPLLRSCDPQAVAAFYRGRVDFGLFEDFPSETRADLESEISLHLARTAMDSFMGTRLRNLAEVGIERREWPPYQLRVQEYYEQALPDNRKALLTDARQRAQDLPEHNRDAAFRKLTVWIFYDVDRLRLMSRHQFESYIEEALTGQARLFAGQPTSEIPSEVLQSLEWMNLPPRVGTETLKQRYRELALVYHPDKGGTREEMQMLNTAYQVVKEYMQML